MIDEYTGKKIVSPLDFTVEVPKSEFGKIKENQITLGGKFIVNESNLGVWNLVLSEINALLIRSGLKVYPAC